MIFWRSLRFIVSACAFAWGCSSKALPTSQIDTGGNTSWLKTCAEDAQCGQGGICFGGVCSSACEHDDGCTQGQSAGCFSSARSCDDTESVCLPKCDTGAACSDFGDSLTCSGGFCVPATCVGAGSSTGVPVGASNDAAFMPDAGAQSATASSPSATLDSTTLDSAAAASTTGDLDAAVTSATPAMEAAVTSPVLPSGDATLPDAGTPADAGTFSVKMTNPLNCCDVYTVATPRSVDDTCLFVEVTVQVGSITTVTGVKRTTGAADCWDRFLDEDAQEATVFDGDATTYFEGDALLMTAHATASFPETSLLSGAEVEVTANGIPIDQMWHTSQ
jgi:hypothetical protein